MCWSLELVFALCLRVKIFISLMASTSREGGKKDKSKRSRVVHSSDSQRDPNPPCQYFGDMEFSNPK